MLGLHDPGVRVAHVRLQALDRLGRSGLSSPQAVARLLLLGLAFGQAEPVVLLSAVLLAIQASLGPAQSVQLVSAVLERWGELVPLSLSERGILRGVGLGGLGQHCPDLGLDRGPGLVGGDRPVRLHALAVEGHHPHPDHPGAWALLSLSSF